MSFANIASNAKAVVETSLFAKNLTTLVKGVRALKDKEQAQYIAKALAEIKTEISSNDFELKTEALRKLIFLQMLGYDMSWASFHVIEIMSQSWFGYRRVAYLAAALCFTQDTPVTLLATNLLKQTFQNSGGSNEFKFYDVGTAISCLAGIVTPTLAEHLILDIYNLMNSNSPYLRKKSILALFRIFLRYPKALKFSFDRLKEKLGDENQGVVAAAIYVLCELAARNPKNYLAMAPQFYGILTSSSNNWVLIKVVKLLGALVPLEPRLAKKLQEPLMEIISSTGAKSLMYECVNTLLSGELTSKATVRLCLEKLTIFVEDPDQNLKYLGLLGLHKLMTTFPRLVTEHKDLILSCLEDEDETIRIRALDLVSHMVTPKTLPTVIRKLVDHLQSSKGSYRDVVLEHILRMCCNDTFGTVVDFEWLIIVLLDLTRLRGVSLKNAILLRDALSELLVVVPDLRPFAICQFTQVTLSGRLCRDADAMSEVLSGIVFSIGEYAEFTHSHLQLIRALLSPSISLLSPSVQTACVHAAIKVLGVSLAQPYFKTSVEASEWEQKQLEQAKKQNARANDIKANTQDDEDEYEEDDEDEDEEDEDDDEEEEKKKNKKRRAKRQEVFSVGHTTFIGRTLDQHVLFIEEILCHLLARFAHFGRSSHAEVQERAQCYRTFLSLLLQDSSKLRIPKQLLQGAVSLLKESNTSTEEIIPIESVSQEEASKPAEIKKEQKPFDIFELFNTDMFDPLNALVSGDSSDNTKTTLTDTYNLANSNHVDSILALLNSSEPATTAVSPVSESKETEEVLVSLESDERTKSLSKLRIQLAFFFAEELLPPGLKTQRKVEVPEGLDLDDMICDEPDSDDEKEKEEERKRKIKEKERDQAYEARFAQTQGTSSTSSLISSKNKSSMDEKPKNFNPSPQRNTDNPFYLGSSPPTKQIAQPKTSRTEDILADLDLSDVGVKSKKKDNDDDSRKMNVIKASKPSEKSKKQPDNDDEEFEGEAYTKESAKKNKPKDNATKDTLLKQQTPSSPIASEFTSTNPPTFIPSVSHSIIYHDEYITLFLQAKSTSTQVPTDGVYNAYISLTACGTPSAELIQIPALQCTIHPNKKSYCETQQSLNACGTSPSQIIENPDEKGSIIFQAKKLGTSNAHYATAAYQIYSKALSPKNLSYAADLTYRIKNGEQTSTVTKSITIHIPISSFVVPVQKTSQEVVSLLSANENNLDHLSTMKLSSSDIPKLIRSVSAVLRVALIESSNITTLYYGTYSGAPEGYEHICVYAKIVDNDSALKIDIKTCSQQLSDSLLEDLQRLS